MQTIFDLWQIAKKDLLEFRRDRLRLITFFIMPIFMMIMVGFIFPNQNSIKNISIGVVNQDNQSVSQGLVESIIDLKLSGDNPAFVVKDYSNIEAIKDGIKKQEISGGLFIPSDFSTKIAQSEQTEVTVVEDQSNPQISQMVNQVLVKIIDGFSGQLGQQKINQILVGRASANTSAQSIMAPIQAKLIGIIPGNPNYFEFVAPGIMAMIVMTAVLTGLAASISREKEQGTLDGILISPINRLAIILGKALSQSIRGLIQGAIVLLLAFFLFGVTVHGSLLLVALLLILGIFSFVGLGILVSAIATEQETATQLLFMFQFPMLFLSGVFFPILMMPSIMQKIAHVIPLTYAITALRKVMVLGAGFGAVRTEFLILLIFGVVTLTISVPVFKRVITK
ncbi:MAG: ABC transporter permease [Candidatus Berkelbacteria bacterium]|nr:ABC transporter permease [Candidatus Berkelbacteria bacterium]